MDVSEKNYFQPRPDNRTYENAMIRASYLVDNGYVKLSQGLTYEQLLSTLITVEMKNNS